MPSTQLVLRIHHDGDAVVGDRQLDVLDAGLLAGLDLGGADRPRGVADVGLAAAELLEAAAGAGDADRDADALVRLLELLGHGFADREDRARAVDLNDGRRGRRRPSSLNCRRRPRPASRAVANSGARMRTERIGHISSSHAIEREFRACFLGVKSVLRLAMRVARLSFARRRVRAAGAGAGPGSGAAAGPSGGTTPTSRRTGLPTASRRAGGGGSSPTPRARRRCRCRTCSSTSSPLIAQLEAGDRLRMAAVEALGHAQDRRQRADRPPQR